MGGDASGWRVLVTTLGTYLEVIVPYGRPWTNSSDITLLPVFPGHSSVSGNRRQSDCLFMLHDAVEANAQCSYSYIKPFNNYHVSRLDGV